jgi:hypothetical protein
MTWAGGGGGGGGLATMVGLVGLGAGCSATLAPAIKKRDNSEEI